MLKEFWKEKSHIIQITGILIGVGALFLAIPTPAQESAKVALLNLQFLWLMIISVACTALLLQLWVFLRVFEKELKKKDFDIEETVSLVLMLGILFFIINLWQYASALYSESFFHFAGMAGWGFGALFGSLGYQLLKWSVSRVEHRSRIIRIGIMLFSTFVFSTIFGAWISFTSNKGSFTLFEWFTTTSLVFALLVLLLLYASWHFRHNAANYKEKTSQ